MDRVAPVALLRRAAVLGPRLRGTADEQPRPEGLGDPAKATGLQMLAVTGIGLLAGLEGDVLRRGGQDQDALQVRRPSRGVRQGARQGPVAEELRFEVDQPLGRRDLLQVPVQEVRDGRIGGHRHPSEPLAPRKGAQEGPGRRYRPKACALVDEAPQVIVRVLRDRTLDHDLDVVPRLGPRLIVPPAVEASLVQVEAADIEGPAVEHRQLLVVRDRREGRDREELGPQPPRRPLQPGRQPRYLREGPVQGGAADPAELGRTLQELAADLRVDRGAGRRRDERGVHRRRDGQTPRPPRRLGDLGRGQEDADGTPRQAMRGGGDHRVEIRDGDVDVDAPTERVRDQVHPVLSDRQPLGGIERRARVEDTEAGAHFRPGAEEQPFEFGIGLFGGDQKGRAPRRPRRRQPIAPGHAATPSGAASPSPASSRKPSVRNRSVTR